MSVTSQMCLNNWKQGDVVDGADGLPAMRSDLDPLWDRKSSNYLTLGLVFQYSE